MAWFGFGKNSQPSDAAASSDEDEDSQTPNAADGSDQVAAAERQDLARYRHREHMARLKLEEDAARAARKDKESAARRAARQRMFATVGQWLHPHQSEATLSPLEKYRARIESFEEDRETLPEKFVRSIFLALAYVLPFIVALAIGKEIGDAYSGTTDYWADGWSIGTHTVAYAGEFSLAMMVLSTSAAFRRYKADSSYTAKLLWNAFFFAVFIAASSLAQWFIAEQHIHPKNNADLAALIFRVVMPPAVDIASMLYISIMGYKSLKKFLAEQQQKAEAIKQLNEAELTILKAQQEAARRQKEDEQYLTQRQRREDLLLRIEEIHSQAMVQTAQQVLLGPGNARSVRVEEDQTSAREHAHAPLSEGQEAHVPLPGVRSGKGAQSNHHSADQSGIYERWTGESESADGTTFPR